MATEQTDTSPSPFDDPWTKYFHDLGRAYPSGTKFQIDAPPQLHPPMAPYNNWLHPGRIASALGSNYPNPWEDINKYTPTPLTSKPPPNDALKFWQHPSPKVIPIREGSVEPMMNVPLSHLQHMAGQVIYPSLNRFLPVDPNAPWISSQRFENTGIQPSGQRILPPNPPDNVLTFSPRAIDRYLK